MRFASFVLAGASAVAATAIPAEASEASKKVFHVTGFSTLCDEIFPGQECVSRFNVTYEGFGSVPCSVNNTATDYVFCSVSSPETAQYAYIKKGKKNSPDTLKLKFTAQLPGTPVNTTYGSGPIPGKRNFDVPVTKQTSG